MKVNLAVDRLPEFTSQPGVRPGGARRHDRAGRVARRHRERVPGGGRGRAARRCRSPTSASRACSTTRWRPRASTSCRCSPSGCRTPGTPTQPHEAELEAYADRVIARIEEVAPGLHRLDPAPAGDRAVRDGARVRPRRRQHLPRRAVARPDVPHAARGRLRRLPHADARAVPGRVGHPRRRRGHRHPGPQRGAPDPRRPPRRALAPPRQPPRPTRSKPASQAR